MRINRAGKEIVRSLALGILLIAAARGEAGAPKAKSCRKLVLTGEVSAGLEWRAAFGQGWVFRVLPIDPRKTEPGKDAYSGWDLVVDREQPVGFPDALLLATPPYNSINEREVGTTFGLRAQDAIGWNPRSFRFLTDQDALRESRKLFEVLGRPNKPLEARPVSDEVGMAIQRQLKINQKSSTGQFRILDARLTPGIGDAAGYAENWAVRSVKTPHKFEPASGGRSTPLGELHWMRFSVTLWVPESWQSPRELHAERAKCQE